MLTLNVILVVILMIIGVPTDTDTYRCLLRSTLGERNALQSQEVRP